MTVETKKLHKIASVINDQAGLLRRAGRLIEASGMEERAAELLALCGTRDIGLPTQMAA